MSDVLLNIIYFGLSCAGAGLVIGFVVAYWIMRHTEIEEKGNVEPAEMKRRYDINGASK